MSILFFKAKMLTMALFSPVVTLTILMTACGDINNTTPQPTDPIKTTFNNSTTVSITSPVTTAPVTNSQAPTAALTTVLSTTATLTTVTNGPVPPTTSASGANGLAPDETEVSFTSGQDKLYGTLLVPKNVKAGRNPAALIIVGHGEIDRNFSNPANNIYQNFARVLADQGVISLRYDKIGTGETGLASYAAHPQDLGFNIYIDEARAAYDYLKSRLEVDPSRLMILGHSEGGLIALALADQLKSSGGPKALVLASGESKTILQLFRDSLVADYADKLKNGTFTQTEVDNILAEFDSAGKTLLATGKFPDFKNLGLYQYFPRGSDKYFAEQAKVDPAKIATSLARTLPVLLFCGEKDSTIFCKDVKILVQEFENAGNKNISFDQIPNMDHFFKDIVGTPHPETDMIDPRINYSALANDRLADFVKTRL